MPRELPVPVVTAANFLTEVRPQQRLPLPGPPEIAIAGRSNVGKSTLLNRLAGRRALARTSKTPGRTRGIMIYDLMVRWPGNEESTPLRLVDLPGYGYAKVSQAERKSWQPLVEGYVKRRETLALFVTLVDARRETEVDTDQQLAEWLLTLGVEHRVVATKIDKLSASERGALQSKLRRDFGGEGPPPLLVSGHTGEGVDRLWRLIERASRPATGDLPPVA